MDPKCLKLEGEERFTRLLAGAPETCGMKSGFVTLKPGESVGEHSTGAREECVVILSGEAQVSVAGKKMFDAGARHVLYIPPDTSHDIRNSGGGLLSYLYIVCKA